MGSTSPCTTTPSCSPIWRHRAGSRWVPRSAGTRVTYHDPCYLARYNDITDAPRKLIAATGAELVEMPRHGTNTFCCGAGGGRIWTAEPDAGERPSEQRIREAQALGGLDYFVVSCPKDLTMYTAAAVAVGGVGFEVVELDGAARTRPGLTVRALRRRTARARPR